MKFIMHGFGDALDVYENKPRIARHVTEVIHSINIPLGYKLAPQLPDQIKESFVAKGGWQKETPSLLQSETNLHRVGRKTVDLRHAAQGVDIEIERGNVASLYRDIFKFNIHKKAGLIELGVVVTAVTALSHAMGENITRYERVIDELSISWKYGANADCPVLVIGLQPYSYPDGHYLIDQASTERLAALKRSRGSRPNYPISRP